MEKHRSHQLKPGTILDGRYEIGSVLGEGGFGITYSGVNVNTGEKVAIKEFFCRDYMDREEGTGMTVISADSEGRRSTTERRRFLREARIIRDFRDEPGIVTVLDYFEENDTAYIVMELVEGTTLRKYVLNNGRYDPKELFEELRPLMQALGKLHEAGLVHRDISPDNIVRKDDGQLVLIDFGSAKYLSSNTETTSPIFKSGYAPPEQCTGKGKAAAAIDVYGLSATMYYCLTNKVPLPSLQRLLFDELKPVSDMVPVPEKIDDMISRGMELKPQDRYGSVEEMLEIIDEVYPYLTPEEKERLRKKKKQRIIAAIAAVLVLIGIGAGYFIKNLPLYRLRLKDTVTVHFTWEDEKAANKSCDGINKRVRDLAGEGNYYLKKNGTEATLMILTSAFEKVIPEDGVFYDAAERLVSIADIPDKEFIKPKAHCEMEIDWESTSESSQPGKNQCDTDSLKGESMVLGYLTRYTPEETGDWTKMVISFKNNLDALGIPYAFGTDQHMDKGIAIMVRRGDLSQTEALILSDGISLYQSNGFGKALVASIDISQDEEGKPGMRIQTSKYSVNDLEEVLEQNKKYGFEGLYLRSKEILIAYIDNDDVTVSEEGGSCFTTELLSEEYIEDPDKMEKFLNFLEKHSKEDIYGLKDFRSIELYKKGKYEKESSLSELDGSVFSDVETLTEKIAKETGYKTKYEYVGDYSIHVQTDDLPTEGFETGFAAAAEEVMCGYDYCNERFQIRAIDLIGTNVNTRNDDDPGKIAQITMFLIDGGDPSKTRYMRESVQGYVWFPDNVDEPDEKATTAQYEKIMEELDRRGLVDSESVASKMSPHLGQ